ncbi:MAG: DUF1648 domain-containing protein [Anaerolineae bacterium]|nr:DUF1648 domain-containing protein [Anaerolineae bacterium]
MNWTPDRRKGVLIGIGWIVLLVLIDGLLLWRIVGGKINGWTFIAAVLVLASLPAMVLFGYWLYGLARLRYEFDRNRLVIYTAAGEQIVPMSSVTRVIAGREAGLGTTGLVRAGLAVSMKNPVWPGYWIGSGVVQGLGLTLFYAVTPPAEQAIVVTPSVAYGISAPDMEAFVEVFRAALRMGPSIEVMQSSEHAPYLAWPIWGDRLLQSLALGSVLINVLLFGILTFRYPGLPERLPLHFDAQGMVDRIADRQDVFDLPVISLIVLGVNGLIGAALYRRYRVASYLVWGGGLMVQVFFFLALWNVVF